jgi:hypothetical protein
VTLDRLVVTPFWSLSIWAQLSIESSLGAHVGSVARLIPGYHCPVAWERQVLGDREADE